MAVSQIQKLPQLRPLQPEPWVEVTLWDAGPVQGSAELLLLHHSDHGVYQAQANSREPCSYYWAQSRRHSTETTAPRGKSWYRVWAHSAHQAHRAHPAKHLCLHSLKPCVQLHLKLRSWLLLSSQLLLTRWPLEWEFLLAIEPRLRLPGQELQPLRHRILLLNGQPSLRQSRVCGRKLGPCLLACHLVAPTRLQLDIYLYRPK